LPRPLKHRKVQLNERLFLVYEDFPRPKGRHVTAWYLCDDWTHKAASVATLVGGFKTWQVNKYVAKSQCHNGRGKNTTYMYRVSWVQGECVTVNGEDQQLEDGSRTFEEWKRALRINEISVRPTI
jgi:hypothetical protein